MAQATAAVAPPAPAPAAVPEAAAQLLEGLNDAQREAVLAPPDGVLVVLAGPGSGAVLAQAMHCGRWRAWLINIDQYRGWRRTIQGRRA